MSEERRCGTCKWWALRGAGNWRHCLHPIPAAAQATLDWMQSIPTPMQPHDGDDCPTWAAATTGEDDRGELLVSGIMADEAARERRSK